MDAEIALTSLLILTLEHYFAVNVFVFDVVMVMNRES